MTAPLGHSSSVGRGKAPERFFAAQWKYPQSQESEECKAIHPRTDGGLVLSSTVRCPFAKSCAYGLAMEMAGTVSEWFGLCVLGANGM